MYRITRAFFDSACTWSVCVCVCTCIFFSIFFSIIYGNSFFIESYGDTDARRFRGSVRQVLRRRQRRRDMCSARVKKTANATAHRRVCDDNMYSHTNTHTRTHIVSGDPTDCTISICLVTKNGTFFFFF